MVVWCVFLAMWANTPMRALTAAFLASLAFGHDDNHPNFDVLDFVDPLIGTANGGRYHLTMIDKKREYS